jgi:acyl carrier protein
MNALRQIAETIETMLASGDVTPGGTAFERLDSLKLVELILKLEEIYSIRLNADDIDAVDSIDSLAGIIERRRDERGGVDRRRGDRRRGERRAGDRRGGNLDGGSLGVGLRHYGLDITQSPAALPLEIIRVAIAEAEMRGPQTRLAGTIQARQPATIAIARPDGEELFSVSLQAGQCASFDLLCDLDLARHDLRQCRVVAAIAGRLTETDLAAPEKIVIPEMQELGLNRRHLARALPDNIAKPTPAELLARFDTLGDNCEFGVFARLLGDGRSSLFRAGGTSEWMTIPRPGQRSLADALEAGLEGFAEPGDLRLEYIFGEWMAFSNRYDFCVHTGVKGWAPPDPGPELLRLQQLKRDLLIALADPWKIFTRKSNSRETEADLRRLLAAMRCVGDSWLLWLSPATESERPGTVTMFPDKLVKVAIASLAEYTRADRIDCLAWLGALSAVHLVMASPLAD